MKKLCETIRTEAQRQGHTIETLSKKSAVHRDTVSKAWRGIGTTSQRTLDRIGKALGLTLVWRRI